MAPSLCQISYNDGDELEHISVMVEIYSRVVKDLGYLHHMSHPV